MSDDLLPVDGHVYPDGCVHLADARRLAEGRTWLKLDAVDFAPIQAALTALAEAARRCAGLIAADGRTGSAGFRLLSQTAERWRAFESAVVSAGAVSADLTTNALLLTYDNELPMAEQRMAVVYELWDLLSHHRRGRFGDAAGLDMLANQADAATQLLAGLTPSAPPAGAVIPAVPAVQPTEQTASETTSTGMTWQEAAERMERLRGQGEPFTSQHKLAELFGCSSGTINKAIHSSPQLTAWAKRATTAPRAQSITPVVTDRTAQVRELNPEDEAAIREYIEQADPETKGWFLALPTDKQLEVVNDPDKHQKLLGRKP
ncbi:MAG: hypothetical protein ACRELG_21215 [Gemmataceae bacterium]